MEADNVTSAAWLVKHPPPRVFAYEVSEGFDPTSQFPKEVFLEVLFHVPPKDVMLNISRVSKRWNEICSNEPTLWQEYLYQSINEEQTGAAQPKIVEIKEEEEFKSALSAAERWEAVNKLEALDDGLNRSKADVDQYSSMNEWKRYYVWKKKFDVVRWVIDDPKDSYQMTVSEDGKRASVGPGKAAHANAWGKRSFKTGVHRWKVLVDGLEENGFWCALGVTTNDYHNKHFVYDTKGGFTGYSGAGDVFSFEGEKSQGTAKRWKSGDVITIRLDCDHHTIDFWINDEAQPSIPTLEGELWPWANGYVNGCSMTLLH